MFWKALVAVIVLFWAVMTGLLLRDVYFPDQARFAEVPPRFVLELFMEQSSAFNNVLHLYHEGEKKGQASFRIRRATDGKEAIYDLLFMGSLQKDEAKNSANPPEATWRFGAELAEAERWKRLQFEGENPADETRIQFAWSEGAKEPTFEIRRGDQVLMNLQNAQAMLAMQGLNVSGLSGKSGNWLPALMGGITARESLMEMGGKRRKCYLLKLTLTEGLNLEAQFSEIGELVRIDLPGGYVLLDPVLHGLVPTS